MAIYHETPPPIHEDLRVWEEILESSRGVEVLVAHYPEAGRPHSNDQIELALISVPEAGALFYRTQHGPTRFSGSMATMGLYPRNAARDCVARRIVAPRFIDEPTVVEVDGKYAGVAFPQISSEMGPKTTVVFDKSIESGFVFGNEQRGIEHVRTDIRYIPHFEDIQRLLGLYLACGEKREVDPRHVFSERVQAQAQAWEQHIDMLIKNRIRDIVAGTVRAALVQEKQAFEQDRGICRAKGDESQAADRLWSETLEMHPSIIELLLYAGQGELDSTLLGITRAPNYTLDGDKTPFDRACNDIKRYSTVLRSLHLIIDSGKAVAQTAANQ